MTLIPLALRPTIHQNHLSVGRAARLVGQTTDDTAFIAHRANLACTAP